MELYVLAASIKKLLEQKAISTCRVFVGNYMTSLEMAGCSVSMLRLDDELKRLLQAPCASPALTLQ